ncbi:bifunctional 5,10-methylenetetrahydrofolate dehydrogenase/5,10-methenyltetrahydrofolate cyclohydrolase [Candidatus Woesebacteria bacterium]|nr:bifunctional 5,10-methylenetetrahydrofolate dehydrogenase/5,10-methenyltetrahydrofolate cyclohydrolase [Candidatus Woesebacteria bacterium]
MAIRFDGKAFAAAKEQVLAAKVQTLKESGRTIVVHTTTFQEDAGSQLYTKLKHQAATRIGIDYQPHEVSFADSADQILSAIQESSDNPSVTGVMVQKPSKQVWMQETGKDDNAFQDWWQRLTDAISPQKDVDCLTQTNLNAILNSTTYAPSQLLPATVAACLTILHEARIAVDQTEKEWNDRRILVVGRSAIVGKPLAHMLSLAGHSVVNVGKDFSSVNSTEFPIIISAVGVPNLFSGGMVADQSILIDVGSPQGDFDLSTVERKALFYTPVPGGVGPVTISCLLENCLQVASGVMK